MTVLFVVILAGFIISGYAQISEYNYSIQNLEKSIAKTNEENDTLQLKIAELSAPERIIKIAQEELGMALNEEQVIILSKTLN
ncbi:cell division protein FtsL [Tepidibacillus decaturensis]|uniref:cell division protein FtsL n=1 Tax=Tepidibacillus decaturensis TaxID=1413211 RepID=UPI0009E8C42C|nr:cell division protein FtsL [Tepidibacillus decaturensis]